MSSSAFTPTTTQVTTEVPVNVPVVTAWTAYTPATITGYTTSSSLYEWRRLGDTIQVRGRFLTASTSATAASFTLPSGLTARSVTVQTNGLWTRATTASSQIKTGHLYSTNGSNVINFSSGNFSTSDNPQSTFNGSGWGGSGEVIVFDVWAVINEWAGSGTTTLADRALEEYAFNTSTSTNTSDSTSFGYGPSGAQIQNITAGLTRRVRFQTAIQATDKFCLEVSINRVNWQDVSYRFGDNATSDIVQLTRQLSTTYGIGYIVPVNSTDIDITFGQYAEPSSATYGSAGRAWSVGAGSWYWRIRKVSSGAQVGFPISTKNIVGATDGVAPVTGMLGESTAIAVATATSVPSGTVAITGLSQTLSAGTWAIFSDGTVTVVPPASGMTAGQIAYMDLRIQNTTDATTLATASNVSQVQALSGTTVCGGSGAFSLSSVVQLSSPKTFQVQGTYQSNLTGGSTQTVRSGRLWAVRIA